MKQLLLTVLTIFSLLSFTAGAQAQVTGSISPNNITSGDTVTVTLNGLQAGETYTVKVSGVGENGTEVNEERTVTADQNGKASWTETIDWPADTYETNVSHRIGTGQPDNTSTGTLNVNAAPL